MLIPERVRDAVAALPSFPAYVYDLPGLAEHAAGVRAAFPHEIFYAAKANPDPAILRTLRPFVDGVEVSSGGELRHVRSVLPGVPLAFGGPGKTAEELALPVQRLHVESPRELDCLDEADILLRVNLALDVAGASLAMSGPFGLDDDGVRACLAALRGRPALRLRGFHAHLASGLEAPELLAVARRVAEWAEPHGPEELNLGGGMAVDYGRPDARFGWAEYAAGLAALPYRLRIEPGRALTAYHGWYVTEVLDVKRNHGTTYAILRGGTQHLRTPVTKGHDQPFVLLDPGTGGYEGEATLVGQLCTPKDVFATGVPVAGLRPGSVVAFGMAGAYAWNISHHEFLMHARPGFHYVR